MTQRVLIVGGGIAGIATAYELTRTPERRDRYAVTILQSGWRLGGKCASGRNAAVRDRIEEHGLHVWFGNYENACELMRECYAELGRPAGAPLATFDDAFHPSDDAVLYDDYAGRWTPTVLHFPRRDGAPGDGRPIGGFWHVVGRMLEHLAEAWTPVAHLASAHDHPAPSWLDRLAERIGRVLSGHAGNLVETAVGLAEHHATHPGDPHEAEHRARLADLLDEFRRWLWDHEVHHRVDHDALRGSFCRVDFVATIIVGLVRDDVVGRGFDPLNDEELLAWLARHGAAPVTLRSPIVRSWYSAAFAFADGDVARPDTAAGVALHSIIRQNFAYKGAMVWKMQAGMGDAVVAPFYEVLQRRGVDVQFFTRVTDLRLDAARREVAEVHVVRQLRTKDGNGPYRPLVDVDGLPCWPSLPLLDQLDAPADLHEQLLDGRLDFAAGEPEGTAEVLRLGDHFDVVVLAASVAALPAMSAELLADPGNPAFARMIAASSTVRTQALQVWTHAAPDALGWTHAGAIASTFVEPIDTYCDMSHLLPRERWRPEDDVAGIAYFCGVLPDTVPDAEATAAVHQATRSYLADDVAALWPAAGPGRIATGFDWDLLADPVGGRHGIDRFEAQYWRANTAPTERYVLSRAGSISARLRADESGYDNLVLAGDWTKNGLDVGCVEATVMSGRQAARAITGEPIVVPGEDHGWIDVAPPGGGT